MTEQGARRILVAECDAATARHIVEQLRADGYRATVAGGVAHVRALARQEPPELVIVGDLGQPREALELIAAIRRGEEEESGLEPGAPLIRLSGRRAELDVLRAFEAGADDVLAKPFSYLELRARVRALLRRAHGAGPAARRLRVEELEIDTLAHSVSLGGRPVALCRREYELLVALAAEPDRVFTREELLRGVWGFRAMGQTRTLDSHASRLRRKLGGGGRWVVNVWGVGYRLTERRPCRPAA